MLDTPFMSGEDYLRQAGELRLLVPRKPTRRCGREPWLEIYKSLRKWHETTIGEGFLPGFRKDSCHKFEWFLLKIAFVLFCLSS